MSKIRIRNSLSNSHIETALLNFEKDKKGTFKDRKYRYTERIAVYPKSELELVKSEIEFAIENSKTWATIQAYIGGILTVIGSLITLKVSGDFLYVGSFFTIYFANLGIFIYWQIAKQNPWLLIIKLAIAQKSKYSESMTGFHEWNDPEEDIYNLES